jgi:hypothetical protein
LIYGSRRCSSAHIAPGAIVIIALLNGPGRVLEGEHSHDEADNSDDGNHYNVGECTELLQALERLLTGAEFVVSR